MRLYWFDCTFPVQSTFYLDPVQSVQLSNMINVSELLWASAYVLWWVMAVGLWAIMWGYYRNKPPGRQTLKDFLTMDFIGLAVTSATFYYVGRVCLFIKLSSLL